MSEFAEHVLRERPGGAAARASGVVPPPSAGRGARVRRIRNAAFDDARRELPGPGGPGRHEDPGTGASFPQLPEAYCALADPAGPLIGPGQGP